MPIGCNVIALFGEGRRSGDLLGQMVGSSALAGTVVRPASRAAAIAMHSDFTGAFPFAAAFCWRGLAVLPMFSGRRRRQVRDGP